MSRHIRTRAVFAGLAATMGVATFAGTLVNSAQAKTSYGADRNARAEALGAELDAYLEAAKTCDLNETRLAYEGAESVFNAVEIDFQFASPQRYEIFEHIYIQDQVPSSLGLEGDDPYDCAEIVRLAEEQAATWDEVTRYLAASPAETPLFDDVATLRGVNQGIRSARAAIDGNAAATPQTESTGKDPAAAAAHWAEFVADYPTARVLIEFRNPALATQIDGLVANVTAAFEGDPSTGYPAASAALAALAGRFGLGANLITAAARNTNPNRTVFNPDDYDSVDFVGDIVLTFFEIRDLIAEGTPAAAAQVKVEYDDWLAYPMGFKTGGPLAPAGTAALTAVNNYVAAQTPATTQALLDQVDIWEQIYAGQFWGTPELVRYYAENQQPGAPVFVATLSPEANIPPGPVGATGSAIVEIDADGGRVCQAITYDNVPEPISMAHIHRGAPGVNGPVVVDFLVLPSGREGCVDANPAVLRQIVTNPAGFYVNLHTDGFPSGVLRGVLAAR